MSDAIGFIGGQRVPVRHWELCPECKGIRGEGLGCSRCGNVGYVPPTLSIVDPAVETKEEPRCAYERCQAGGIILPGAPWKRSAGLFGPEKRFHPGCLAAEQFRARADAGVPLQ